MAKEGNFLGWDMMGSSLENKVDMKRRMKELQSQVDELKDLVNTLLSVICEEPDGVHTGAAPTIPGQSHTKFCM
ncbi:MAG: hypothetical protein VYA95_07450 [Candidatus Thermoplasmatota archaeon]|nr:hypothetical protein [Candidatus Thermoplasmatota archaeon]MED6338501.1 hypothetical protein [Candidatus Thermoplasmatota archaeon]DAC57114.1 MAG TPA: hypothetical protein D7I03_07975 [Candidatus Poseidoniales archaeon]HII51264.1 hypothetical protein [Candidatus Poseidoniaceae archaeon]